ncbi:MAG: hypothetical protein CMC96_05345 [Flavobacteriales bacterium]|nr:hypothetical protein [Flavobacteriales bacterium]|tara:strand:+ start:22200 stop:22916 length:717 start_codon:yes stop_codon:yes gene_type:complete
MKKIIHRANSRGHANHGWLDSHHTFSFANYYNPERMHFGVLRVLNDDRVAAGAGFGKHPHENMEIVSIPLAGDLEHEDSMGNKKVIREGDIQVMSAGTGVVHSEYNKSNEKEVKFLQIWIFPKEKNVSPRYDQISIRDVAEKNSFYQILSPNKEDQGVWIHQDAWFSMGEFDEEKVEYYSLHNSETGVYLFVLDGKVEINGEMLNKRDGMGIWETDQIELKAITAAKVLLMEVPMEIN